MVPAASVNAGSRPSRFGCSAGVALFVFVTVVGLVVAGMALPTAGWAQDERDTVFSTRGTPDFGNPGPALAEFLRTQRGTPKRPQHFCIVGYQRDTGLRRAWVRWQEGHLLILWNAVSDAASPKSSLVGSRRMLDLTKDVVPRDEDIAGSTYLVTRAWVDKVEQDCARYGTTYVVTAPARKRR